MNAKFVETLGYTFKNHSVLKTALTHSSYANENKRKNIDYNERLEFLGDSVLSIIISEYLFKTYPDMSEGQLTKARASIVCEQSLSEAAKKMNIGENLSLGRGEELTGGRTRISILSDAFEAILAAIFVDGGMRAAREWLMDKLGHTIKMVCCGTMYADYKTMLQELLQKGTSGKVTYNTISEKGPDHNKTFEVEVLVDNIQTATGVGRSKKEAEQMAAKTALEMFRSN